MSLPHHADGEKVTFDSCQNLKGLFLKYKFSPNAYAFAGLEHPETHFDKATVADNFLEQAERYMSVGFDGIKMLEGYPSLVKNWGLAIDDEVYHKFYAYMEKNGYPILIHLANPRANWDLKSASEHAVKAGRVYDESYPTKDELTMQLFNVLKRFPNLKLILAHFGFFSKEMQNAEKFLSYKNTLFDITPGGEQLIYMSENWQSWLPFWQKYSDRILYGSDFYAFPKDEKWKENFTRRPYFIRNFLETNTRHDYVDGEICGVMMEKSLLSKVYRDNFEKTLGKPKSISLDYLSQTAKNLLKCVKADERRSKCDLEYILNNI